MPVLCTGKVLIFLLSFDCHTMSYCHLYDVLEWFAALNLMMPCDFRSFDILWHQTVKWNYEIMKFVVKLWNLNFKYITSNIISKCNFTCHWNFILKCHFKCHFKMAHNCHLEWHFKMFYMLFQVSFQISVRVSFQYNFLCHFLYNFSISYQISFQNFKVSFLCHYVIA